MCCLFGMIDHGQNFSGRQKSKMMSALATACEARGTDATGIAYNGKNSLLVRKRPVAAHQMRFCIPNQASVIMGHTRMTTQGSARKNRNNHPFLGAAGGTSFALAHNGVLYNDTYLRQHAKLPMTNIETDSYVAVQLIEKKRALTFASLKYMAEEVEGSFCFTVLDDKNILYFVKGDNPLCIYYYPRLGLYLYASTEDILRAGISQMHITLGRPKKITLAYGDILRIDSNGTQIVETFHPDRFHVIQNDFFDWPSKATADYYDDLRTFAGTCGYGQDAVDLWLREGFSPDEIEEFLYCGEL